MESELGPFYLCPFSGREVELLLVFRFQIDPRGKPIRLIFEIRRCTVVKFDDEQKKGLRILMLTKDGPWPSKYRSKYRIRLGSKATETMFKFFCKKTLCEPRESIACRWWTIQEGGGQPVGFAPRTDITIGPKIEYGPMKRTDVLHKNFCDSFWKQSGPSFARGAFQ